MASKTEDLVIWGRKEYKKVTRKNVPLIALHAAPLAASRHLLARLKPAAAIANGLWLAGWQSLPGSPIVPLSTLEVIERTDGNRKRTWARVGLTTGAYKFRFKSKSGSIYTVLYVMWEHGPKGEPRAIALVPFGKVQDWHRFEKKLDELNTPPMKPSHQKAYIIGSHYQGDFKPTVVLTDVILPELLKREIVLGLDEFFRSGVKAYRQMGVPAFRKYLFYGAPGNGKSMLAQALAADQLKKKRVVVFVSASDEHGANFNKIQSGLNIARENRFPVLVVVEEIDAYVADPAMRAQVLDVLDGFEAPDNPKGSVLLMTSNHPERLDEAILRFGRVDQRWLIPPIQSVDEARQLLQRYLGKRYEAEDHAEIERDLIGRPRVFVRELAFNARMRAAASGDGRLNGHLRATFQAMAAQATDGEAFLRATRRPIGFQPQPASADTDEFPF